MNCIIATKDGKRHRGVIRECFKKGLYSVVSASLRFIPRSAKIEDIPEGFSISEIKNFDFETVEYKRVFMKNSKDTTK